MNEKEAARLFASMGGKAARRSCPKSAEWRSPVLEGKRDRRGSYRLRLSGGDEGEPSPAGWAAGIAHPLSCCAIAFELTYSIVYDARTSYSTIVLSSAVPVS